MTEKSTQAANKQKLLFVQTTQGYAGRLSRESQFIFNYGTTDPACEISLTTPLTDKSYAGNVLTGVLRQNLPEGYLLSWMHQHFGKTMKMDDFNILAIIGEDMIGRVRCTRAQEDDLHMNGGESLADLLAWKGTEDLFEYLSKKYASTSGVSGIQPKVLLSAQVDSGRELVEKSSIKDRNLIVKAGGVDWPGLAENEYHCMSMARKAGIVTPQFWLSDNKEVFIVERFDVGANGEYLGFEDMTSLTARTEKYHGSYEMLAKVIEHFVSPRHKASSYLELFKAVVFSAAVRNGDAHLKNFGLLYTTPQTEDVRLSPMYDVVNTTCYLPRDIFALSLNKTKSWPDRAALVAFGEKNCLIDRPADIIDHILEAAMAYRPEVEPGDIWHGIQREIEKGCASLQATKVFPVKKMSG